jgi:hypothetical protein
MGKMNAALSKGAAAAIMIINTNFPRTRMMNTTSNWSMNGYKAAQAIFSFTLFQQM